MKIPVYAGPRLVEYADSVRAALLSKAPNAEVVYIRKNGQIARINLRSVGDDSKAECRPRGRASRFSHDHETENNPPRVWTFRNLPKEKA